MKNLVFYFFLCLIAGCTTPHGEGRRFFVQLQMPENFPNLTPERTEVKLINTSNGTTYKVFADETGMAAFDIEFGIYRLSAQLTWEENLTSHLFNAGLESIRLTPSRGIDIDTVFLQLTDSPVSKLIIKELYYVGCSDDNGKNYSKDGYLSIYNNSEETAWLDSLCIGLLGPMVANKISPWLIQPESLPICYMGWQFPGTGQDYPLHPGEEIIVALNAVNHTSSIYNHPNSVDLSKADWAFYDKQLTGADISVGVPQLNLFLRIGTITNYILPLQGPGMILYRIQGCSAAEYAANSANLRAEPPANNGIKYLMIPTEWVLECVDCVEDITKQGFKRVPSFLDAETTFLPSGKYSGRSLHRKVVGNKNGRLIYQDTNNSANDFEEQIPAMKSRI